VKGSNAAPTVSSTNCDPYYPGSTASTETSKSSTFKAGVGIKGYIGINLSSEANYSSKLGISFSKFTKDVWICGTKGGLLEKNAGLFVVEPKSKFPW
jgi:hypothetical protein